MAAARKKAAIVEIESIDLISLLTIPGQDGIYEAEIALAEPGEIIEEPELEMTVEPTEPESPRPAPRVAPTRKKPAGDNLESLTALMKKGKPANKTKAAPKLAAPLEGDFSDDSFEKIAAEIAVCEKCELHKTRNKTVPGVGSNKARLVFIGEAPGADEDAGGIPFVGRAGKHLDKILTAAGFNRDEVFICNILKCRPPGNRNPTLEEMLCCTPYLQRQLRLLNPSLIACLGNVAIKYVIGSDTPGITRIHGQWFNSIFDIKTMAMYHPSYLIRSESREKGSPNWQMWQDIQQLKKAYDALP